MPRQGRASWARCCRPRSAAATSRRGAATMPEAVELIRAKRDGRALTDEEIGWLIASYTGGAVADEQMSALLMAIYFQGLGPGELRAWTAAMVSSGERLDLGAM